MHFGLLVLLRNKKYNCFIITFTVFKNYFFDSGILFCNDPLLFLSKIGNSSVAAKCNAGGFDLQYSAVDTKCNDGVKCGTSGFVKK